MDFGNYDPGPRIFTFRTVMLRLILLELYVEVVIHRINKLPTFHTGFFRSLARGKYPPWQSNCFTHGV
jgi:hypothetical protein